MRQPKKNVTTPRINDVEDVQRKSIFGRQSEAEIISQIKVLALNPCRPQFTRETIQGLRNQILKLRKVMVLKDSEAPWKKRKLDRLVKDNLRPPSGANEKNLKKQSRRKSSHASSASCLVNSPDSAQLQDVKITSDSRASSSLLTFDVLPQRQVTIEYFILGGTVDCNCLLNDVPPITDSDESVKGSNQLSSESIPNPEVSTEAQYDGAHSRPHETPRRSIRSLHFIGDHLQRKVVPVGPRFQTDVPEWTCPAERGILVNAYKRDPRNSVWLGTRAWPIQNGNTKTNAKTIGKGRPDSCCCVNPESVDCVRLHILEERLVLQSDLGHTFFSWKFDEMGDVVSEMWTLKEQQIFESLVKMGHTSNGKSFLKRALKSLSKKNGRDIVNYYFNVYIPNRMSMHTRSTYMKQVDTDDDEEDEDINYMGSKKISEGKSRTSPPSKDVKSRYLRRIS